MQPLVRTHLPEYPFVIHWVLEFANTQPFSSFFHHFSSFLNPSFALGQIQKKW